MLSNPSQCIFPNVNTVYQRVCCPSTNGDTTPRTRGEAVISHKTWDAHYQNGEEEDDNGKSFPSDKPHHTPQLRHESKDSSSRKCKQQTDRRRYRCTQVEVSSISTSFKK